MRNKVLAAVGLTALAMASWSATPAKAMMLAAPAALKSASDSVAVTETVNCDCGEWGWRRPYYRHYERRYYRSYDRSYDDEDGYYDRPHYRQTYRPHHRYYWSGDDGWYPRPRHYRFGPPLYDYDY